MRVSHHHHPTGCPGLRTGFLVALLLLTTGFLQAQSAMGLEAGWKLLRTGNYEEAETAAAHVIRSEPLADEDWHRLRIEALMSTGRYADANAALTLALSRQPGSIRIRLLGREVALSNGMEEKATELTDSIRVLVTTQPWSYRDPVNLITFGRMALIMGADPKEVLDRIYQAAERAQPELRDIYLAKGELALAKHDYALAATAFHAGVARFPEDADMHYGLAQAYENSDRGVMLASLAAALEYNPRHVPSLLLHADHQIAAENYREAENLLGEAREINPSSPEAWAYHAAIAHLRNQSVGERISREEALRSWSRNPKVDHIIGRTLSQKYRFAEGADYQRKSLDMDPRFLRAKAQLASDLLRLGQEEEGWRLIREVHARDGYDVEAFNLVTLSDTMKEYRTIATDDFIIRMTSHEAAVYGPRVLDLLTRASDQLVDKYGATLATPTIVEIFADQRDFAVRTFGVPDVPGYLGVCFGRLVTANSPAANSGQAVNWESVLWHEFCHVVTLQLTNNRMPRWLSEGISVYEERLANAAWGDRMNPRYREMILADQATPVSLLSSAFLAPRSPLHLQFAYFQSSLVVEFIIERFGLESLRAILRDLGAGAEINQAIAANTTAMANIEREFSVYAREQAERLGRGLDWTRPDPALLEPAAAPQLAEWARDNPDNFWAALWQAGQLADRNDWQGVINLLDRIVARYPTQAGTDSAYRRLAEAHRALGDIAKEREVLSVWAAVDSAAVDAYLRLMELAAADQDWENLELNAERYLAVNPLVAPPHRVLGQAKAGLEDIPGAITAYRTLLEFDPQDPAEVHFTLANWLHQTGDDLAARLHVLQALEEAPRFREALKLLQDIVAGESAAGEAPAESTPPAPTTAAL